MTRGEAKESVTESGWIVSEVEELIDTIYNDFESRVCENCKWLVSGDELECSHMFMSHQVYTPAFGWCDENFITTSDFGCNKWEQK